MINNGNDTLTWLASVGTCVLCGICCDGSSNRDHDTTDAVVTTDGRGTGGQSSTPDAQPAGQDGAIGVCETLVLPTPVIGACIRGPSTAVDIAYRERLNLTVSSATPQNTCFVQYQPWTFYLPADRSSDPPAGETVGWELVDDSGGSWQVEFILPSLPVGLLSVGDGVSLSFEHSGDLGASTGYVMLEKNGNVMALFSETHLPDFLDLQVAYGETECVFAEPWCGDLTELNVTWQGQNALLRSGETAVLGDLTFTHDHTWDNTSCLGTDGPANGPIFGAHR